MKILKVSISTKILITLIVAVLFSACRSEQTKVAEQAVMPEQMELVYHYSMETSAGELPNYSMGEEQLLHCVKTYCEAKYNSQSYFYGDVLDFPEYISYKAAICAADILSMISTGVEEVTIDRTGGFSSDVYIPESSLVQCVSEDVYQTVQGLSSSDVTLDAVRFHTVKFDNERIQLQTFSSFAAYVAWKNALTLLSNAEELEAFINSEVRVYPGALPDELKTAVSSTVFDERELALDLARSLQVLVERISTNSTDYISQSINIGVMDGDQWFNEEYGRKPALRSLLGSSDCNEDEVFEPNAGICWKRCPLGFEYNASSGECTNVDYSDMYVDEARYACEESGGRLPTIEDVVSIFEQNACDNYNYETETDICPLGSVEPCKVDCTLSTTFLPCFDMAECSRIFDTFGSSYLGFYLYVDPTDTSTNHIGSFDPLSAKVYYGNSIPCNDQNSENCMSRSAFKPYCVRTPSTSSSLAELLPENEISTLPKETPSISKAVQLLAENNINFIGFAQHEKSEFSAFSEEQLYNVLLERVNAERMENGQPVYASHSQLVESNGITSGDFVDAVDYMYSSVLLFPRELSFVEGDVSVVDAKLVGWYSPYVSIPPVWYTGKNLTVSTYKTSENIGIPLLSDISSSTQLGLFSLMNELLSDISIARNSLGDGFYESAIPSSLVDTQRYMYALFGGGKYDYISQSTELELSYSSLDDDFDPRLQHFRIYPLGDDAGISQFDNYLCAHDLKSDCVDDAEPAVVGQLVTGGGISFIGNTLGFEDALLWANSSGTSSLHTEGAMSVAAVAGVADTVLISSPLDTLTNVPTQGSIDVYVPEGIASYPYVRLEFAINSLGVWYEVLGSWTLDAATYPPGAFHTLYFDIDSTLYSYLTSDYDDLVITIKVNSAEGQEVLFDNLQIGVPESVSGTSTGVAPLTTATWTLPLTGEHQYWMVERKLTDDVDSLGDNDGWHPIGVHKVLGESDAFNGAFIFNGALYDELKRIVSMEPTKLHGAECEGPNGECLDPNWVPAIQNEIIGGGSSYESSYDYYLTLAKQAAQEAQNARETLMGDIIDSLGSSNIQEAQIENYLTDYFSGIGEICGDSVDENVFKQTIDACLLEPDFSQCLVDNAFSGGTPYACEYAPVSDGINNAKRTGPVQCAVNRRCAQNAVNLKELGVLAEDGNGDNSVSSDVVLSLDSIMTPAFSAESCSGQSNAKLCLKNKLSRIKSWALQYKQFVAELIRNQTIPWMPDVFAPLGQEGDQFVDNSAIQSLGFNYGEYYEKLQQIDVKIDDIATSAETYLSYFDQLAKNADLVIGNIERISSQNDINILEKLFNAQSQVALTKSNLEASTLDCIRNQRRSLGFAEDGTPLDDSDSPGKIILKQLDSYFKGDLSYSMEDLASDNFANNSCIKAVDGTGYSQFKQTICNFIQEEYDNVFNTDSIYGMSDISYYGLVYKCEEDTCRIRRGELHGRGPTTETTIGLRCIDDKSDCNDWWYYFEDTSCHKNANNGSDCDSRVDTHDGCAGYAYHPARNIGHLCASNATNIALFDYDVLVPAIEELLTSKVFENCSSETNGCSIDGDGNPSSCTGPVVETLEDQAGAWDEGGELASAASSMAQMDQLLAVDNFGLRLIELGSNISSSKNMLATNIKGLVLLVAELTQLEERQIDIFDKFIANRKTAVASNITALSEWSTRFDYRKEEYQLKLQRARYLAWVALRAIEFRFGIKLEDITQGTPTMEAPYLWVKNLWGTWGTQCGVKLDGAESEDGEDALTECLQPEQLIERYVENLSDFVLSYGNNPTSTTQWWFHEDDDTGVISLRDHIAFTEAGCVPKTENMLYFTEEFDMDAQTLAIDYAGSMEYWDETPATWEKVNTTSYDFAVYEGGDVLGEATIGATTTLEDSHYSVYPDQNTIYTADYLDYPANTGATVHLEQLISKSAADAAYYGNDEQSSTFLEFSLSHRRAPVDSGICGVGEVFFSDVGRCGVLCSVDSEYPAPQGTCSAGQVCMSAGSYVENGVNVSDAMMCNWCTADKGCINQDGQAFTIHLMDGNGNSARRNVLSTRRWDRSSVNTFEDNMTTDFNSSLPADSMLVAIENSTTRNKIFSSENFTNGWNLSGIGTLSSGQEGPDASMGATLMSSSGGVSTLSSVEAVGSPYGTTASIWMKSANSGTTVTSTLTIMGGLTGNPNETLATREVSVDDQWTRYTVETKAERYAVQFQLSVDSGNVLLWGAQMEDGLGATPYLATNKNLLANSNQISAAWGGVAILSVDADATAPNGVAGVNRIADDSFETNGSISYGVSDIAFAADQDYVFSVWVKKPADVAGDVESSIFAQLDDVNGALVQSHQNNFVATDQWQRIEIQIPINNATTVNELWLDIYPVLDEAGTEANTGALYIWGPQLELGTTATGYQETGVDPSVSIKDWGFDVGVSEAGLVPLTPYDCSTGSLVENCVDESGEYARNTYHRSQFPVYCDLENIGGLYFPTANEIIGVPSEAKKKRLFIEGFENGKTENGDEYYYYNFRMNADSIQHTDSMNQFGIIAPNNFNYRIRTLAVNVAGTDVLDCSLSQSPSTCAANQWISYDFSQTGPVTVKNHHMKRMYSYDIPQGVIRGGKAWTAEQVIGYPVSGAHQSALSQLQKIALMGRPLDGIFEIRVYDLPELIWDNVEDIQLVLGYHYWTKSE